MQRWVDRARPTAARYEPGEQHVVLTLYTLGDDVTPDGISAYEAAAESMSGDVDVVVALTDDDPPAAE